MKRITALLLVLACAFVLFACQGGETINKHIPDENKQDNDVVPSQEKDLSAFTAAIANTVPQKQIIRISLQPTGMADSLNGTYEIVFNADGSATINYSYEQFNEIGAEEEKSVVSGTVYRNADGSYSGSISGTAAAASSLTLDLAAAKDLCIVEGNVLSATVPAAQTAAILGVAFESDVAFVLTISNGIVINYSLSYAHNKGAVNVSCDFE